MKIRDATEEDLPEIVEIYNSTVPGRTATADPEPVTVESRRAWFSEHSPERRPLWVAEADGGIAGWFGFEAFRKKPAYHATAEISVYVAEEHRRKGVGRALLAQAIRRAPGLGLKTLTAGAFAHNGPSMRLFEGFGFERWAYYPRVAELDGVERDLVVLGLRLDGAVERRLGERMQDMRVDVAENRAGRQDLAPLARPRHGVDTLRDAFPDAGEPPGAAMPVGYAGIIRGVGKRSEGGHRPA